MKLYQVYFREKSFPCFIVNGGFVWRPFLEDGREGEAGRPLSKAVDMRPRGERGFF